LTTTWNDNPGVKYNARWDPSQCIRGLNCASDSLAIAETESFGVEDAAVMMFAIIGLLSLIMLVFQRVIRARNYHKVPQVSDVVQQDFASPAVHEDDFGSTEVL